MREKISAALLSFVFLISLFLVVPALMATSDSELIEQLIKSNGKSTIISIIRKHRQNNITVIVDGQLQESFGPPDEKYVTAKTILEDLKKMRLSLAEFIKMVGQKTTTGTQVAAEKKNAEQKTLTETPSKAEIPHDKAVALFLAGQYDEALDHANESLSQAEIHFGKDSIELSKPLSLLADIRLNRKRYQEAADHLERLRAIQEDTLGISNGQVVNTMTRLIEVYEKLGDNAKANRLNELADSRWGGGAQRRTAQRNPGAIRRSNVDANHYTTSDAAGKDREEQMNKLRMQQRGYAKQLADMQGKGTTNSDEYRKAQSSNQRVSMELEKYEKDPHRRLINASYKESFSSNTLDEVERATYNEMIWTKEQLRKQIKKMEASGADKVDPKQYKK